MKVFYELKHECWKKERGLEKKHMMWASPREIRHPSVSMAPYSTVTTVLPLSIYTLLVALISHLLSPLIMRFWSGYSCLGQNDNLIR